MLLMTKIPGEQFVLNCLWGAMALVLLVSVAGCGSGGGGDAGSMPNNPSSTTKSLHGVEFDTATSGTVTTTMVAPFGSFTTSQVVASTGLARVPQSVQVVVTSGTDTVAGIPATTTTLEWMVNYTGTPANPGTLASDGKTTYWLATATDHRVYMLKKVDVSKTGVTSAFDLSVDGELLVAVTPAAAAVGAPYYWMGQPRIGYHPTAPYSETAGTIEAMSVTSPSGISGCMHMTIATSANSAVYYQAWVHPTFGLIEWRCTGDGTWSVRPGVSSNG